MCLPDHPRSPDETETVGYSFVHSSSGILLPPLEGIRFVQDFLAEKQPGLKAKNPADFMDLRFVRKLEVEGFFKNFQSNRQDSSCVWQMPLSIY
jgi:hypothetical protein